MASKLLTVAQAAKLKQVTPSAIYLAVKEGRLPHTLVLGHIGVKESDVLAWTPIRYAGRPGVTGRRPKGTPMSDEAKARLSESQKRSWQKRKKASKDS